VTGVRDARATLTPVLAHAFHELGISVSLWTERDWWYPLHIVPSVAELENYHGKIRERWDYNRRCYEQARRDLLPVLGHHAGFSDFFVPIVHTRRMWGLLVAGPFATSRPTSGEIRQRWLALTGSHGRLTDPEFSRYVATTLSTLTLEGPRLRAFERFLACFAALMSGRGVATTTAAQAERLRDQLIEVRSAERMWDAARGVIDQTRVTRDSFSLGSFGLRHLPAHAVIGLLRGPPRDADRIDQALRRDALQRAAVDLARKTGSTIAGQLGDYGIALLVDHSGPTPRIRSRLGELAARAEAMARRLGLALHAGIAVGAGSASRFTSYRTALQAAERALSRGTRIVFAEPVIEPSGAVVRKLRGQLGASIRERAILLAPRFDRYVDAVLAHAGYRLERARAEIDAGVERLAEPLLASGLIAQKSFDELLAAAEREADDADTVAELVLVYRRLIADIERVLSAPTVAEHDRGIRRALDFIRDHVSEPLTVAQIARVAGFAPDYFGRLFKRSEGVALARHVRNMRIERARQMLEHTALTVAQVQRLSGFRGRTHFHHAFRDVVRMTPIAYRAKKSTEDKLSRDLALRSRAERRRRASSR
jgi:AraC-like DNA-binding protein